jgi:hypothetical protein
MTIIKKYNEETSQWEPILVGQKGDTGEGVPAGGSAGQVLAKASGTAYDTVWRAPYLPGSTPFLNYSNSFTNGTAWVSQDVDGMWLVPDNSNLRPTGDFEIILHIKMTDWTPSAIQTLYYSGASNASAALNFALSVNTSGTLELLRPQGSTARTYTSSVATGVADGSAKWIRVVYDVNNGSGSSEAKFYTGDDGTNWTQLGTTITVANTNNGNANPYYTTIGNRQRITNGFIGEMYRVQFITDPLGTPTTQLDIDFGSVAAGATSFTESSTNAFTVYFLSRNAQVGVPNAPFIFRASRTIFGNRFHFQPFVVTEPIVVDMLSVTIGSNSAAAATFRLAIFGCDSRGLPTGNAVVESAELALAQSVEATYYSFVTPTTLQPGTYAICGITTNQITLTTYTSNHPTILQFHGGNGFYSEFYVSMTYGSISTAPSGPIVLQNSAEPNHKWFFMRWYKP